ncbi:uncharacterized protein LOC132197214 isoform X3 [Neocloeon triangulifer]|uniref:uncharacterized protein LOC132197214 isoform X3 n=1 Tax=Neocloeon triangulifer TaxID=2078957 RepID=UPI00286F50F7|nr:uncharacterized protein LOC132197214 isoform X3 [Neocloeon triangulifer]
MDSFFTLSLLSLLHMGHPQDYRPNPPYNNGPQDNFGPAPFVEGPEARMPPPDYLGSAGKAPNNYGPPRPYFGPPLGPMGPQQYGRPPPNLGPGGPPPFQPFDPYAQKRPFNKPPPFNGPYGQALFQGPPGSYGQPPRRPDFGPPPMNNRPPWGPGGFQQGPPPGYQGGPPGSYQNGPGNVPGGYNQQGQPQWPNRKPEPAPQKPVKGPMDFMADVVNSLATRVLLDHVTARGNFVFSPYGATSVLCVLNEGSSGMSAVQLSSTLNLPKDAELVRVGMRDLHRHLKSYFKHNGFLQGVDLSHNNTSLRADFIPLLRFYGYHVDDEAQDQQQPMETTTMPMNDEETEASTSQSEINEAPPSDSLVNEDAQTEEPPAEEQATEEAATEEAAQDYGEETRRKKRASKRLTLWKDIVLPSNSHRQELNNGLAQQSPSSSESSVPDPLAPRKRFRLFSGDFTEPVVVQERTEMLLFSSLPQLGAVAALLPLDEPRYGLLVLVPYDGRPQALKHLVKGMTNMPLRSVLDALKPNHVHVTVPSFSAKGTVVLTSALQQIGIHDIFDPRNAKLDKMSVDPGLFVRHLEQVIDMNFGKVTSLHTRVITARSTSEVLDATRPFVYFVIDRLTQVALLAGIVEDPTTQRIF